MSVIEIKNLTKAYTNQKGIFDLSLNIEKGEVFGYLGPNGSGKTTTIRHLLGFLNADKGSCSINNMDCRSDAAKIQSELGYLPGEIAFFNDMSGMQFLKFMADMRKLKDFSRAEELIQLFELDTKGRLKKMSKGMKQKIGLICAFMHDPSVLILDEPTSGLDPLMQNKFIELILEEKKRGKTILMSSHSFEEVDRTCDRVGIIKEGRLIAVESVMTLKQSQRKTYVISFDTNEMAAAFTEENFNVISIHNNVVKVVVAGNLESLISTLTKYKLTGLDVSSQSLEEVFLHYYGGEK